MARGLLVIVLVAACGVTLAWGQCEIEKGRRRQGGSFNDFSSFTTETPEECCKACQENERCMSWTRDRRTKACAFKDSVPGLTRDSDFDSGVVGGSPAPRLIPAAKCLIEAAAKYGGGDVLKASRASSARKCCRRCENNLECFSWYYNRKSSRCVLNRDVPKVSSRKKVAGGTVV
ncbi:hypothetical protein BSKO_12087 [Bryopsis sp. KO-2023]|nr:hypothetical protein BSKO_12087 [Bryopsis sp. KO-2023]